MLGRRLTDGQSVEYALSVDAEDVRRYAAESETVVAQSLVDPVAGAASLGDQCPAVANQLAQVAESSRRDDARHGEAELADARQPQAAVGVRLPAGGPA